MHPCPVTFRVDVTDEDIRAAKKIWLAARDGGATEDVVASRYRDYANLVRTQAQQVAEAVRAKHAEDDRMGRKPLV